MITPNVYPTIWQAANIIEFKTIGKVVLSEGNNAAIFLYNSFLKTISSVIGPSIIPPNKYRFLHKGETLGSNSTGNSGKFGNRVNTRRWITELTNVAA